MAVVDADGHVLEPVSLWGEYVPSQYRDRIFVEFDGDGTMSRLVVGSREVTRNSHARFDADGHGGQVGLGDALRPGGLKPGRPRNLIYEQSEPGGFDPARRLEMHDTENIVAAVLFPTLGLGISTLDDPDIAEVACQAVNNWVADYAAAAPGELYPVATVPTHFPELAAGELRRCVETLGFVAGWVRSPPTTDGRHLDHPSFEPLWVAAEDLDVPVCVHNGSTVTPVPLLGADRAANHMIRHAAVHPLEGMMAFASLFQGDVLNRHRGLRVGFCESSCGWAPFWLDRLDEHAEVLGWLCDPPVSRLPTEVFMEQCVIGCEGDEPMVPYVQSRLGEESVMWASDYPHYDTEPPFTDSILSRSDLSDAQRDGVLWRAALRFYGLDGDRILEANAKRRGLVPT